MSLEYEVEESGNKPLEPQKEGNSVAGFWHKESRLLPDGVLAGSLKIICSRAWWPSHAVADWVTSGEFRGLPVKQMSNVLGSSQRTTHGSGGRGGSEAGRDHICVVAMRSSLAN